MKQENWQELAIVEAISGLGRRSIETRHGNAFSVKSGHPPDGS
jgi:hypothetical protein